MTKQGSGRGGVSSAHAGTSNAASATTACAIGADVTAAGMVDGDVTGHDGVSIAHAGTGNLSSHASAGMAGAGVAAAGLTGVACLDGLQQPRLALCLQTRGACGLHVRAPVQQTWQNPQA